MKPQRTFLSVLGEVFHRIFVLVGALGLTLAFFLVLPLMQTLTKPSDTDLIVQNIDTAQLDEPPPPPEEEQEEEEPEPEEAPPELTDEAPPLDLSQLEVALNPGFGEGMADGDFAINLSSAANSGGQSQDVDALFSIADLDQKPRAVYQPGPQITKEMRAKAPGTVHIIFIVDQRGRVENPIVQNSTDPVFDRAALNAIKQWKFEPGKRSGEPVKFRMRVPITFPKG